MNITELTDLYAKSFVKAKSGTRTRELYQKLVDIGEKQGIKLNRIFFLRLSNAYLRKPEVFESLSDSEIEQKIMQQMQLFITHYEMASEHPEQRRERRINFELEK